jgi:ubiquinone/menaquinone biosynthesis C-methylase UbiE
VSTFESLLQTRSAAVYADFLVPHLADGFHLLDVGCGPGSITVGLADHVGHVVGVDPKDEFDDARRYAAEHGLANVEFRAGDVYELEFLDDSFDACLCHSMLETLARPLDGLREIMGVLKPSGVLGVACVEYGGLILAGPRVDLLRWFYAVRERLWQLESLADPYRGRQLRGLLEQAGFAEVAAAATYLSYGTPEAVRSFGTDRAADCGDTWYRRDAIAHGLATETDLDEMQQAWSVWSESPDAYAAFAWCRAVGRKPA